MMDIMVKSKDCSFAYPATDANVLEKISFSVGSGECILFCGCSGCGKTTLLRLINGLSPNFFNGEISGSFSTMGMMAGETPIEEYVSLVGSVFQNPKTQSFNVNTTAELAFPCENMGMEAKEIRRRVAECAEELEIEKLLDRSIFCLSGGEKQRLAFASACMLKPPLLVLDEPTSNLDGRAIDDLRELIRRKKAEGVTIVIAEHRLAWLKDLIDKCYYFEQGELKRVWNQEEFNQLTTDKLYQMGLRAIDLTGHRARIAEKKRAMAGEKERQSGVTEAAGQLQTEQLQTEQLQTEQLQSGQVQTEQLQTEQLQAEQFKIKQFQIKLQTAISVTDLQIGYQKKKPVDRIPSFHICHGEIVGLMGHNGAGKSTLAKTLCGLLKPLSGQVNWHGKKASWRELIGKSFLVMQDVNYQLFCESVGEEVTLGAERSGAAENALSCEAVLAELNLSALKERHPMSLSGGQKQRVAVASAILCNKEFILFDEPTSGLDHLHMEQVGKLLKGLKEQGKAVLVITHDEELAADWCDRIIDLDEREREYGVS